MLHDAAQRPEGNDDLEAAIEQACARIAPTWPLDRFIAVNPLWGWIEQPLPDVSSRLTALCGSGLHMPRRWYREAWRSGRMQPWHLQRAIERTGSTCTVGGLIALLQSDDDPVPVRSTVAEVLDADGDPAHRPAWSGFVTNSISQTCAAYFDRDQATFAADRRAGLFGAWRERAARDWSPRLRMGLRSYREAVDRLPVTARETIRVAVRELSIPPGDRAAFAPVAVVR